MAALIEAIVANDIPRALALIDAGADVNALSADGKTALRTAVRLQQAELVDRLLKAGALVNQTGPDGVTALYMAVIKENTELVDLLLKAGADPTLPSIDGLNPITHIITRIHHNPAARTMYDLMVAVLPPVAAAGAAGAAAAESEKPFQVLCDPIGYDQHSGECWFDTIQEIFFFSDKVKEFTQILFYHMTDDQLDDYLRSAVGTLFPALELKDYRRGFLAMRDRFKSHYDMIRYNKRIEACTTKGPIAVRRLYDKMTDHPVLDKRVKSGELARIAAQAFQTQAFKQSRIAGTDRPGAGTNHMIAIFLRFFYIFRLPFQIKTPEAAAQNELPIHAVELTLVEWELEDKMLVGGIGHSTGIFKCGGTWVYYDDNHGILPIDPLLVKELFGMYSTWQEGRKSIVVNVIHEQVWFYILEDVYTFYFKYRPGAICAALHEIDELKISHIWSNSSWTPYSIFKETAEPATVRIIERGLKQGGEIIHSLLCVTDDPSRRSSERRTRVSKIASNSRRTKRSKHGLRRTKSA